MSQNSNSHHNHHCCHRCGKMQPCGCHENRQSESKFDETVAVNGRQAEAAANTPDTEKAELSLAQAIAAVQKHGYSDLSAIAREEGRYKVSTTDAEIYVDAETGNIVGENDDDETPFSKDEAVARIEAQAPADKSKISDKENAGTSIQE